MLSFFVAFTSPTIGEILKLIFGGIYYEGVDHAVSALYWER